MEADTFASKVLEAEEKISAAQVQAHLLLHRDDSQFAIEEASNVKNL